MIDETLGHYRILERVGAGGMGVVYRARDERLERDVAVKVLPAGALADEEMRKRFRKEALALSKLNHPNIATIYDFDTENEVDFLAMEYISGVTLGERLLSGPVPEAEAIRVGKQVADALEAAHEKGLIHRDLKPGNIMVTPKGLVKLLDFGLAKLFRPSGADTNLSLTATDTRSLAGTLPYMAPEQLDGRPIDERTDIHALGAVLYELTTRHRSFPQEAASQVIQAIVSQKPAAPTSINPEISKGFERIVLKCLEKDPSKRYASARELAADLERIEASDESTLLARMPGLVTRRSSWRGPVPVITALMFGLAALLLALNISGIRDLLLGWARPPEVQSLAVLPLVNISQDPEQDYLAEGIADSLITELGQISTLRVISRTSISRYRDTEKSLPEIAEELKVGLIVEGSVMRSGERMRVAAKLIRPPDERQLWAKSYERDLGDFLALQSEITQDITKQIGIRLSEESRLQLARRRTVNPRAIDAYFKGVYSGDTKYFNEAVTIDPDFALAYAKIAADFFYSGLFGELPPREAFANMKQAALTALEMDQSLGEAHGYLAVAWLHHDLNWEEAEKQFKRAFELNPSLAEIHHLYAHYLMAMNRIEESLAEVRLADGLDPFAWDESQCFGWHCLFANGYDEAIDVASRGLQADDTNAWAHVIRGWSYEQQGMITEAIADFQSAVSHWEGSSLSLAALAHAYGVSGQRQEAEQILEQLLELSRQRYVPAYDIAVVYVGLGETDRAFDWLLRAYEERSGFLVYIRCDRRFDGLRSDPRHEALLKRIGLPIDAMRS